jgi:hypothetical protein
LRPSAGERRGENRLFTRALLQLEAEAVLFHLENGEVVFPHQVDDGFDVFKFQRRFLSSGRETLGKAVLAAWSSRALADAAGEARSSIIENPRHRRLNARLAEN